MSNQFITKWTEEEFKFLHNVALEQVSKYHIIGKYFTEEWLSQIFATRFNQGIPPIIRFLTQQRLESSLVVMDQVFSMFNPTDKEFLDKIYRIKQHLPYQTMKNYFGSCLLELYIHAYLTKIGVDCCFRRGAGADLEVKINKKTIDIEVTTRYNDLLDEEFKDLLLRCLPHITQNYRVKLKGRFISSKSLYEGMIDLQNHFADENSDYTDSCLQLGLNNEVILELTKAPEGYGYIVNFDEPHFIGAEMVHNEVEYKVRDKAKNPNQTGTGRPVIVVVGVGNIDDSAALAIMNDYKLDAQYSSAQIPKSIDAVSMYWHTLDSIRPARVLGTLNDQSLESKFDSVILNALGIK